MFGAILTGPMPRAARAVEDVEATIAAARRAAHENRNADAARLFQQAAAAAPELRISLLPELADQLTYSGQASKAIPLYREALASRALASDAERHAVLGLALALSWNNQLSQSLATYDALLVRNPRDINALLGYARVLSWQDRLTASLHEYERVLAFDPRNQEALDGIARVQSWRGRQRDAQRRARKILANNAADAQAAITLANSELWMGRPDQAGRDGWALLSTHRDDSEVRNLTADLAEASEARAQMTGSTAASSDKLTIHSSTVETETRFAQGSTSLGARYQPIVYVGQPSVGSASEARLGFFARSRLNDCSEINGTVSNDEVTATGTESKNLLLYDTWLTLWPDDTLRFDVGSRRETFDNVLSLQLGVTAVFETLSMDVTPDENDHFSVRANQGAYSDGNRRGWEQAEFERVVLRQPRLSFGARTTGFSFSQSLNDGYFAPPRYRSAQLTTHLWGNVQGRLWYDVSGAYGREWVLDGGTRPTHAVSASLAYFVSRPVSVSAFYNSFDTRESQSGFARTTLGLGLQTKW